jgi:hypothetical protein
MLLDASLQAFPFKEKILVLYFFLLSIHLIPA